MDDEQNLGGHGGRSCHIFTDFGLFWLLIDLKKKIRIEMEKQSLLTTNPLKEIKHKLQLAMTDLKHLDEKILHATELMNKHFEDHPRQSLTKDSA
jgi:hypothetical protein